MVSLRFLHQNPVRNFLFRQVYFFFLALQNGKRVRGWILASDKAVRRTPPVVQYKSCYILGKMTFGVLNVTLRNTTLRMGRDLLVTDARQGVYYKAPLFTAVLVPRPTNP